MTDKELLNAIATILTIVAFVPYIRSTFSGQTKPHVFTWLIWGLSTLIVFFAQLADGGGIGAWSNGLAAVLTLYVALLAYQRRSNYSITRSDWAFFVLAMSSLPLWAMTRNPFWAVVILSVVDTLGYGPTFRKAYHDPYGEQLLLYILTAVRSVVSIGALENYSWTTILFPAVVAFFCAVFIAMVASRRRAVPHVS